MGGSTGRPQYRDWNQYKQAWDAWNKRREARELQKAYKQTFPQQQSRGQAIPQGQGALLSHGLLGKHGEQRGGGLLNPMTRFQMADKMLRSGNPQLQAQGLQIMGQADVRPGMGRVADSLETVGSPQKLANGNLGVVVQNPDGSIGVRDTGVPYRQEPTLEEKQNIWLAQHEAKIRETQRQEAAEKAKENRGYILEANSEAAAADAAARKLLEGKKLLETGKTGTGTLATYLPTFWRSPEGQQLMTIVNEGVLEEAQKMSGALSESDMRFLQNTTISDQFSPETNLKIIDMRMKILKRAQKEARRKYRHFKGGGDYADYTPIWMTDDYTDPFEEYESSLTPPPKTERDMGVPDFDWTAPGVITDGN